MRERVVVKCIESVATKWYKNTDDKWWLKIAIAATKKLGELE